MAYALEGVHFISAPLGLSLLPGFLEVNDFALPKVFGLITASKQGCQLALNESL